MTTMNRIAFIVCAIFIAFLPRTLWAQDEANDFSNEVQALTGDWVAEKGYWRDGNLLLHPAMFTQLGDIKMRLFPEEPALNRTARAVLSHHFEPMEIEGRAVDFSQVSQISNFVLAVPHQWLEYNDDKYFGFWGVISIPGEKYVPFTLHCRRNLADYSLEMCMDRASRIMDALAAGKLKLAAPETPFAVSGFKANYGTDGFVTLNKSNYNGTVNVVIRVSPATQIQPDQTAELLRNFSTTLIDEYDLKKEDISAARFVGTTAEPWIRRELPNDVYGANIVMAGIVRLPDGRFSLVGVNCPNPSWQTSCAYGVDQAKLYITTGLAEQRRVVMVNEANKPLPKIGMKSSDVAAAYAIGRNNGTSFYEDIKWFFKDGSVYNDTSDAPQMIDAATSRRDNPDEWGRWTRKGGDVVVSWPNGEIEDIPAGNDNNWVGGNGATRLSGYYGQISVSGNAITGGAVSRFGYTLNKDGSFQTSNSSMFSVSAYLPNGSATPTQVAVGGSNNVSAISRYEIDGYMITFYYPDGRIERRSFAVPASEAAKASPSRVMIGGSVLILDQY
ncbi:MAG: hypothetical protein HC843_04710 [Sphingomonadales bacterium]|nr:hypothetical protein [Sphingomonadales bacterium]